MTASYDLSSLHQNQVSGSVPLMKINEGVSEMFEMFSNTKLL